MGESGRKWKLSVNPENSHVLEEIETLVRMVGLDDIAPRRHSALFALSIFGEFKVGRLNPFRLGQEIKALESGEANGLKPPIQSRHLPLKGLWHKHYMQPSLRSAALNVQHGLKEFGIPFFQQKIREAEAAEELRFVSPEHVKPIVTDLVEGNWKRLQAADKITGEWIVFAKYNGENYYLALATHDKSTHDDLRRRIDAICCREFPFLNNLFGNA
jgi:hypothetical protein